MKEIMIKFNETGKFEEGTILYDTISKKLSIDLTEIIKQEIESAREEVLKEIEEKIKGSIKYTLEEISAMNNKDDVPNTIQEQSYWKSAGMIEHNQNLLKIIKEK